MLSVSSIGSKVVSSVKNGRINSRKINLPQEVNLLNISSNKTSNLASEKMKFASCGGMDLICRFYSF